MKLPHSIIDGKIKVHGRTFATRAEAEAYEKEFVERVGTHLTPQQLAKGVRHPEDRDRHQVARDKMWYQSTAAQPKPTEVSSWDGHPLDNPKYKLSNQRDSAEALAQRTRESYDRRVAAEAPPADVERRARARAHAFDLWASVAFDATAPMSLVERAKQLIHVAEQLDLDQYRAESAEYVATVETFKQQQASEIDLQRAKALANLPNQFEPEEFEPEPEEPEKLKPREPEPELTPEQARQQQENEAFASAQQRLLAMEALAGHPAARHAWESMKDADADSRWRHHQENIASVQASAE